jgi:hypothetical protein
MKSGNLPWTVGKVPSPAKWRPFWEIRYVLYGACSFFPKMERIFHFKLLTSELERQCV